VPGRGTHLHASVLEPDFDLALGEAEGVADLDAPPSRQVFVEAVLLLQLERLVARVGLAPAMATELSAWEGKGKKGLSEGDEQVDQLGLMILQ
jgi:hypothetical protein